MTNSLEEADKLSPCKVYEHHMRDDGDVEVRFVLSNINHDNPFPRSMMHAGAEAGWAYIGFVLIHAVQFLQQLEERDLTRQAKAAIPSLVKYADAAVTMIGEAQKARAERLGAQ